MAKKVVIAGACRTAIGKMGGVLSTVPAVDMGSIVIKEALKRAGVPADQVDHVYMGCVIQAGLGQNVARQASLNAGLPIETPAVTVNVVCGSGLNCVNMAAQMIQAGDADIVVAGGMESMSMAPFALPKARFGYRMNNGTLVDTMVNDALTDAFNHYHMMITAENVAEQWGLTREELDEFAAASQQKAVAAQESGRFKDEIVPVEVKQRKKTVIVDTDEGPRAGTTAESLAGLRCCSGKEGGVVTAGNASGINDGAAAVVVMSEEKAKELGVTPMATYVTGALGGVDPSIMGVGPVASTKKALAKADLTVVDLDLSEFVTYEQDGFVGVVTINRPKALNALNSEVLKEIEATFDAIDLDATRAVVLTGAGDKSFVAGADIGEMSTLTKAEGEAFGKTGNDVFRKIETFPIPVIAAVNGFALGGGCEISMSCDIRICSENAIFGQPEVGLGITPGFGGTQRLARIVGVGKAKEMIYTAFNIKAEEAYRIGLVNAVYPQEELLAAAKKLANKIASNAPIAVRACKKAINEGLQVDMDQAIVVEEKAFGSCFETEDQKAGMGNFLEKDKAKKLKVVPFQNK